MRWLFTGVVAAMLALVGSGVAQACGCCQGSNCPNCPGGGACSNCPSGGACPNCPGGETGPNRPQQAAAYGAYRYWSSAYGCSLYYDPATRLSYGWSESNHSYYPIRDNPPVNPVSPGTPSASPSSVSFTHTTQYYSPDTGTVAPQGARNSFGGGN